MENVTNVTKWVTEQKNARKKALKKENVIKARDSLENLIIVAKEVTRKPISGKKRKC